MMNATRYLILVVTTGIELLFCTVPRSSFATSSSNSNQMIATNVTNVTLTRLPYYYSSEWGSLLLTSDNLLIHYSNVGLMTYDYSDSQAIWQRFFDYEGVPAMTLKYAVGSVAADPADSDVIYFCSGSTAVTSDEDIDYHTGVSYAAVYRSTDRLDTAALVTGQDNQADFYEYACESWGYARYILDTAADGTEIEGWKLMARNELFAFDNRTTVTIDGQSVSGTVYYLTYKEGLKRAIDDGSGNWSLETIHKDPISYDSDDSGRGTAYSGWEPHYDARYYQYRQTGAAYDEQLHYPAESDTHGAVVLDGDGNPNCDYDYDDGTNGMQTVHGDYDGVVGDCVENEEYSLGTDVEMDTVALAGGTPTLYVGYMTNEVFEHGGLFIGKDDGTGTFTWEEVTHPDTGVHLDVRDIELDAARTVTLSASGLTVTATFYVAAGRDGMFKGAVDVDGIVTLTAINTGFYTREAMLADYPSYDTSGCSNTEVCGQALAIDQAYVDGQSYLLLSHSAGVKFAIDDFTNPIAWYEIDAISSAGATRDGSLSAAQQTAWDAYGNWQGFTESGLIDTVNKQFLLAVNSLVYKVDISSLSSLDASSYSTVGATWHAFHEGFGDRSGFNIVYDPAQPDTAAHFTVIDSGYNSFEWDANKKLVEDDSSQRISDKGLCYQMYYVSSLGDIIAHYEGTDTNSVDDSYLATLSNPRDFYYGNQMLSLGSGTAAAMYLTATGNDSHYTYGIMKAAWDTTDSRWEWTPATGETSCTAKYPSSNNIQNSCVLICEAPVTATTTTAGALPEGSIDIGVDPSDANHLYAVVVTEAGTEAFYQSSDGGQSWLDISSTYVVGSTSLGTKGEPLELIVDPNDSDIVYVAFSSYGVYMRDAAGTSFSEITALDSDDAVESVYLAYVGTSYPTLTDIEAVNESGQTRLYLTAAPKCDSGWGIYPQRSTSAAETPCGQVDHGGIYTLLVGTDTQWRKLNKSGADTDYFAASSIAVSPVDHNRIFVGGLSDNISASGGGLQDVLSGILYTSDGGTTWTHLTDAMVNARSLAAHPTDADKFIVSLEGNGIWEVNLDNPDSDADGIPDDADDSDTDGVVDADDNCPTTANADQADADTDVLGDVCDDDRDGDGVANDVDAYPDDATRSVADGDGDSYDASVDCDDANTAVHPGASESCNRIDDDCDGVIDEPDAIDARLFYLDSDRDFYGTPMKTRRACRRPRGYVPDNTDCHDGLPQVHPGATEVPPNGKDDDCDGIIDG